MALCKVNEIFRGEVSSVQNYGAFIKIPACPQQGLVHRSQVSSSHIDDVADMLQKGDKVWCKVISINEDGKIALSMKLVNQGNGKDLDPNGVQLHLDNQKRKSMANKEEKKAIVLDAVYKTICSKCSTPGHLAKDCFSTPDGKKYELIPEIEEELPPPPKVEVESENKPKDKEKKNKSKKSKKRKKNKSSHPDSSDDEENDTSIEKSKKKKKKSKEAKHKKKKRRHSTSDSEDSTNSDNSSTDKKHSKKCKRSKEKRGD